MSSWRTYRIADLGRVVTGKTPPSSQPELFDGPIPFITPSDMSFDHRHISTERFVSADWDSKQRTLLPEGAVCVVCIGATIGKICMSDKPSQTNQQINSVIVDQARFDQGFVYYGLRTKAGELLARAAGAATPIINKTAFSEVEIAAPPLETQRRIASILGAYDDLIEVNRRRIAVLEEMARGLFEEWFVRFRFPGHEAVPILDTPDGPLPEGWQRVPFGTVADNFDRLRKPLSGQQRLGMSGPYPYYGAAKVFDYIDSYIFEGLHLLIAEDGSVITPDGFPVLQLADGKFWVNNHAHVVKGCGDVSTEYLYLALSRQPIQGYITGAAQPKITQANLNRIVITVAKKSLMTQFSTIASTLFSLALSLQNANERLAASRDLLLPRLIAGQLSVVEAERQLEEAA